MRLIYFSQLILVLFYLIMCQLNLIQTMMSDISRSHREPRQEELLSAGDNLPESGHFGQVWFDGTLVDIVLRLTGPISPIIPQLHAIGVPEILLMSEEEIEAKYGPNRFVGRCLFYEDYDVIIDVEILFYYWFPEVFK